MLTTEFVLIILDYSSRIVLLDRGAVPKRIVITTLSSSTFVSKSLQ